MKSCQATFCTFLKICKKWARFIRKGKLCKLIENTLKNRLHGRKFDIVEKGNTFCVWRVCKNFNDSSFFSRNTKLAKSEVIDECGFIEMEDPTYSLDLTPSDYYLFSELKKHSMRRHFPSDEYLKESVEDLSKDFFLINVGINV
jgi:hypothetical protein